MDLVRNNNFLRNNRGNSLIEFVLILPIFLILLLGIFMLGYYLNVKQAVVFALWEGAQKAAVTNNNTEIEKAINDQLKKFYPGGASAIIRLDPPLDSDRRRGTSLSIKITYTMPFDFRILDIYISDFKNIESEINTIIACTPGLTTYICPTVTPS